MDNHVISAFVCFFEPTTGKVTIMFAGPSILAENWRICNRLKGASNSVARGHACEGTISPITQAVPMVSQSFFEQRRWQARRVTKPIVIKMIIISVPCGCGSKIGTQNGVL